LSTHSVHSEDARRVATAPAAFSAERFKCNICFATPNILRRDSGHSAQLRLLLAVRCGGAGHVSRPSAYPSIAGISLHCREPPPRASCRGWEASKHRRNLVPPVPSPHLPVAAIVEVKLMLVESSVRGTHIPAAKEYRFGDFPGHEGGRCVVPLRAPTQA